MKESYEATAQLWRPMEDMNMPLMYIVTLLHTVFFVALLSRFLKNKSIANGAEFGLLFGLAEGVAVSSFYLYLPISAMMAMTWFIALVVQATAAGAL